MKPEPPTTRIVLTLAGDLTGQTHICYERTDMPMVHTIARAQDGAVFTVGHHFELCEVCKAHGVTFEMFNDFMRRQQR